MKFYILRAYNRVAHSSTHISPFQVCYGFLPQSLVDMVYDKQSSEGMIAHNEEEKENKASQVPHKV